MKKLSVKDLVDFKRRSDRSKKTFVQNMKLDKKKVTTEGGGDYWISSLSAVWSSYRKDDLTVIDEKIEEVKGKLKETTFTITKNMYKQNIAILERYKNMDLKKWRPKDDQTFLKKSSSNPTLIIKGLEIETKPSCIYTFGAQDVKSIGAMWFTAKVRGYSLEEVAMFCEMLYRFLKQNYSKKYQIVSKYCIAVDMISGNWVDYGGIEQGKLPAALTPTINEINKLIKS